MKAEQIEKIIEAVLRLEYPSIKYEDIPFKEKTVVNVKNLRHALEAVEGEEEEIVKWKEKYEALNNAYLFMTKANGGLVESEDKLQQTITALKAEVERLRKLNKKLFIKSRTLGL